MCPVCGERMKKPEDHLKKKHPKLVVQWEVERFQKYLMMNPLDDVSKVGVADRMMEDDKPHLALEVLKDIDPDFPDMDVAFFTAGQAAQKAEDWVTGTYLLRKAMAMNPDLPEGHFTLAMMLMEQNRFYDAHVELEKLDPDLAEPENRDYFRKGKAAFYMDVDDICNSRGIDRETFLESDRMFQGAYDLMIALDYDGAIELFERVMDIDPRYPSPLGNIGTIHSLRGDKEKARKALERALTIDPDYTLGMHNLEVIDRAGGNPGLMTVSTRMFSKDELELAPPNALLNPGFERLSPRISFFTVKDRWRLRRGLFDFDEFLVLDEGDHFLEAGWSRPDPEGRMPEIMGFEGESRSQLGHLHLRWGILKLFTTSATRMAVLKNILLNDCGIEDVVEEDGDFVLDMMGSAGKPIHSVPIILENLESFPDSSSFNGCEGVLSRNGSFQSSPYM